MSNYNLLINNISNLLEQGRKQAVYAVNNILIQTYWQIGKQIVEYEQKGNIKAEYRHHLLDNLAKDLTMKFGKGFSRSNVFLMREFYIKYSKWQTVSAKSGKIQTLSGLSEKSHALRDESEKSKAVPRKLSWSHYVELLSVENDNGRSFYEKQCINENWSVRELRRQIDSALFYRLALSKDKKGLLELSKKGYVIESANDLIKDPYIFEFLGIPGDKSYTEKEFEQKIIDKMQMFLLEIGKGFSFVGRQYRITLDNTHYYVDLVFYHRILKCFVLIDLKIGKVNHLDIGQMNMYLNYFRKEENSEDDNEPIGIILAAGKNNILVEYALGGISNKLFVSKYKLYLPNKKELEKELKLL